MLTLYHARTAVCAIKVRLTLAEKKLPWEGRLLLLNGDQFGAEYQRINPKAVVPSLVADGQVITESTIIMHYLDESYPDIPLMPSDPLARAKVRACTKLVDEFIHQACTVLSFATIGRAWLQKLSEAELARTLALTPDRAQREAKASAVKYGLGGPLVAEALGDYRSLIEMIADCTRGDDYIAGVHYSIADAAATPYIWRLDMLKLSRLWRDQPEVARWYERVRARPSFAEAIDQWLSEADLARYADQPDPWPRISAASLARQK